MSGGARLGIALVLLLGAGLFIAALQGDTPPESDGAGVPENEPMVPMSPGVPAKVGVLDKNENCKRCHEEIWKEWVDDRHSMAWKGALYTELSDNHRDKNCWSCHAPRPILETGLASPAEARTNDREAGITCITCHVNKERTHVVGSGEHPRGDADVPPDCGPVGWPRFPSNNRQEETINFCGRCHNLHGTHTEFLGSKYAREGKTCLSCHMEEVVGPVATGGKPRRRRSHRMSGGHSQKMLQRAMRLDTRLEKDKVIVRIVNQGAGHRVPTDARHRAIRLFAQFYDRFDAPVGAEIEMDLVRLFYRHEQRDPTQIDPEGTLGKNPWRESTATIPERARDGTVRLHLYYMLRHDWPKHKATLVVEEKVKLDAR